MRVGAVVLAAGASTRLGHPKQLVRSDGEPLIRRAACAALVAGADPVIVVLGAHAARVAPALDGMAGLTIVTHAHWRDGLASSLAAGLEALGALEKDDGCVPSDGVLLTVCDQPLVDATAIGRLLTAFTGRASVVAAAYSGTVGVPAVIGRDHLDSLRALTEDGGAGRWLRAHPSLVTPIPLPTAALDVDTAADVERLSNRPG